MGITEDRFWSKVNIDPTGCWLWTASTYPAGYGAFKYQGKVQGAHRVVWKMLKGDIPNGLLVCHTCDVRRCVRPDHLFLGTHKDNTDDMLAKGRYRNHNTQKDFCSRGHEFTDKNTIRVGASGRKCRTCQNKMNKDYMRKIRSNLKHLK